MVRIVATLAYFYPPVSVALRFGSSESSTERTSHQSLAFNERHSPAANQVILAGIAIVMTVILAFVYGHSRFGLATTAVTESEQIAAGFGWSPDELPRRTGQSDQP